MQQLSTAIYSYFTALPINALYTSISGRLYNTMAPTNVLFPYVVFSYVSDTADFLFDGITDSVLVQFSIYSFSGQGSRSTAEIETIYDNLISLFDNAILTVTGYTFAQMNRVSTYGLRQDPEDDIWQLMVDYSIFLQKN